MKKIWKFIKKNFFNLCTTIIAIISLIYTYNVDKKSEENSKKLAENSKILEENEHEYKIAQNQPEPIIESFYISNIDYTLNLDSNANVYYYKPIIFNLKYKIKNISDKKYKIRYILFENTLNRDNNLLTFFSDTIPIRHVKRDFSYFKSFVNPGESYEDSMYIHSYSFPSDSSSHIHILLIYTSVIPDAYYYLYYKQKINILKMYGGMAFYFKPDQTDVFRITTKDTYLFDPIDSIQYNHYYDLRSNEKLKKFFND